MGKHKLNAEHFENKPIEWWPHEERFPDDEFVFSRLKSSKPLKIIEIGPGRGRLTFPIRDLGHTVYAIEINPKFIEYCMKKDTENIDFFNYDAKNLFFEDSSFDFALCIEVIMHLPKPVKVLSELNRVLKPHGKFILMFNKKYSKAHIKNSIKISLGLYKYDVDYKFYSWKQIKKMLKTTKFKIIEVENKTPWKYYIYCEKIENM